MLKKIVKNLCAWTVCLLPMSVQAQSEIYPQHFNLEEVTLLDGPMKTALDVNNKLLLQYDVDRLLTPFIRQAGLKTGKYKNWVTQHPSFSNWGLSDWSLEGHVGGHYLTALALAYAATEDADVKSQMKTRLDYMLDILKDCQDAYDSNTEGLYGFIGGQPINQIWTGLYKGDLAPFKQYGGWVPFYCQHKVLAGLRDAWLYTDSDLAKELFRKMCDWSVNVVKNLTTDQIQDILGWEHGGMNEPLADAYLLFGDQKYLTAAKKYSHQTMISNMQTLNTTFLDGKHANTQVPKYIGFERIYQVDSRVTSYQKAAHNFWQDVAQNRTVCIGGNSVSEHFLSASRGSQYIENLEGPESCNTNNMLKLSEDLFDETHDARYVDFYEAATWNHILSTQDPNTGGYVYFTTLRPQGYRIYSQVNQGMWCCVGTGMENHSKYGHFIYTHSEDNQTLYINLFTASKLSSEHFALTQETQFPYQAASKITIDKAGTYTLAVRHPAWVADGFAVSVNGAAVNAAVQKGTASYVEIQREWNVGDVVDILLPMELRYEVCPNYTDYIAFKYGPILLAAQTTAVSKAEEASTGLTYEALQNEYGGEGRMDHSPGARAKSLKLSSAPLLIGERSEVLSRVERNRDALSFTLRVNQGKWTTLKLVPFYEIQHARYCCYFYQQTQENYEKSDMGRADAEAAALETRTLDFVATGEQQSEAGHAGRYSSNSGKGSYNGEFYRDAQSGGWFEYTLDTKGQTDSIAVMMRFTTADKGRVGTLYVDSKQLARITIPSSHVNADDNGFFNEEYPIPSDWLLQSDGTPKQSIVVRFVASGTTPIPGLYYLRLVNGYGRYNYRFVCTDWTTGDANRVAASKFSYDADANTIRINAGTGNNNVCLMMKTEGKKYLVREEQKYLVVKGKNLNTASGKSYLWWLNGVNRGSSVAPSVVTTASDGEIVVAWDITQSGIDDNCKGSSWDFATGQTIFGLTATRTPATISYIGFQASVDDFLEAVGIRSVSAEEKNATSGKGKDAGVYDLSGRKLKDSETSLPSFGGAGGGFKSSIVIASGKKILK